jgi:hypothetical protein
MNKLFQILFLLAAASIARGNSYSTNFPSPPAPENPISENGKWINGGVQGIQWTNVRTLPGQAVGTEPGNGQGVEQYADSTALLTGTWGSNQTVTATVFVSSTPSTGQAEVELRLDSALSANKCTGYEVDMSVDAEQSYFAIDRWNGALGAFTLLAVNYNSPRVKNGDTVSATITSSGVITAYLNGVEQVSATDTTFTGGNPGMGFYLEGVTGINANYGFTSYTATDSGSAPVPTPTATPTPPASTPTPHPRPIHRHHR